MSDPRAEPQSRAIRYLERQPAPAVAGRILSYWGFQSDVGLEPGERYTVWPDGCASVGVLRLPHLAPMLVSVGPRSNAMHPAVYAGGRLWGIRLWPDCIEPMLGVPASSLRDQFGAAPAPIAARFASLIDALPAVDDPDVVFAALEAWVLAELPAAALAPPDPRIRAAVRAIVAARGEVAMADVAREAALGLRQLQRLFPKVTGLTLREYARVRRLRGALALRLRTATGGWSRVAAESGFVDHAHLTREFVALTGLAPSGAARQLSRTSHQDVAP